MKKYLLIIILFFSSISFSANQTVQLEHEQYSNLSSLAAEISSFLAQINGELNYYLYSDEYKQVISDFFSFFDFDINRSVNVGDLYLTLSGIEGSNYDIESLLEYQNNEFSTLIYQLDEIISSDNQFYDYLYTWSLGSNVESSKVALESIESHMDNLKISVNQLGDKIDQIIVNAGDSSDLLTDIIEQLQMLNDKTGGSESDFPVESVGYYQLDNYGKNVSINHLPLKKLETTGEYNKDVHRMLLNLNRLGSSQNNAALSILTNVQVIATALSQNAEGEEKLEKDLEDKEYQATKAEAELSAITSQNWDSPFTPPRYLSDVHGRLSIALSDPGLPSKITVMDRFYYETSYFNLEIDDLSFVIPQPLVDLANYGRIVFGFVYWSLTFFLALYLFRLWIKLYMYVSNTLINR